MADQVQVLSDSGDDDLQEACNISDVEPEEEVPPHPAKRTRLNQKSPTHSHKSSNTQPEDKHSNVELVPAGPGLGPGPIRGHVGELIVAMDHDLSLVVEPVPAHLDGTLPDDLIEVFSQPRLVPVARACLLYTSPSPRDRG